MKTNIVVAIAFAIAVPALLAQEKVTPLNVKTGQWQSTTTIAVSGSIGYSPGNGSEADP